MSEDGFSDPFDEPSMDLFIETLTGTTFEMRVYPSDTILDIKKKIQRVEGIPIHHQNLLFRMEIVDDYKRLCDIGLVSGSTLKLVLAMRGGPISTRRLSTCDHHLILKDLKDLIEHTREQLGSKLSAGAKVSVLVFKDGDIINLIRVIENDDGSYHSLNDKSTTAPKTESQESRPLGVYNKLQENNAMLSKITELRKKMSDVSLKRHFKNSKPMDVEENASVGCIGEKPLKVNDEDFEESKEKLPADAGLRYRLLHQFRKDAESLLKLHESQFDEEETDDSDDLDETLQVCEDSIALKEKHRGKNSFYNILFQDPSLRPDKSFISLNPKSDGEPSITTTFSKAARERSNCSSEMKPNEKHRELQNSFPAIVKAKPHKDRHSDDKVINGSVLSPLYNMYSGSRSHKYESKITLPDITCDVEVSPPTSAASIAESIAIIDDDTESEDKEVLSPIGVPFAGTMSMSKVSAHNSVRLTPLLLQNSSDRPKSNPDAVNLEENAQEICDIFSGGEATENFSTKKLGLLKRWQSVDCSSEEMCSSSGAANAINIKENSDSSDFVIDRNCYVPSLFSTSPSSSPKNDRISDLYFGNTLNSDKISRSPLYRRYSQIANSSSEIGANDTASFNDNHRGKLHSLSSTWGPLNIESRPKHNNETNNNCDNLLNIQPLTGTLYNILSSRSSIGEHSLLENRMELNPLRIRSDEESKVLAGELKNLCSVSIEGDRKTINKIEVDTRKLENLPAIIDKKRMRCGECNKRLNITNMYHCRCGGIFCGQHRYSEVHRCNYDYKTEGRKLIEQQNPVIVADKLNKL